MVVQIGSKHKVEIVCFLIHFCVSLYLLYILFSVFLFIENPKEM